MREVGSLEEGFVEVGVDESRGGAAGNGYYAGRGGEVKTGVEVVVDY